MTHWLIEPWNLNTNKQTNEKTNIVESGTVWFESTFFTQGHCPEIYTFITLTKHFEMSSAEILIKFMLHLFLLLQ